MKIFRNLMVGLLAISLMLGTLSGCEKRGKCEGCGQTETLTKFVRSNGTEEWYCSDCYRMAKLIYS